METIDIGLTKREFWIFNISIYILYLIFVPFMVASYEVLAGEALGSWVFIISAILLGILSTMNFLLFAVKERWHFTKILHNNLNDFMEGKKEWE